jgi:hypothetical protein
VSQSVIEYGKWTFSSTEIKSGRINTTISLLHSELNPNYFETEVECADPTILSFQRNTPIKYYNGGALIGIFYVQSIKRASATSYKIKADSAISLLNDRQHYGGIYAGDTLQAILSDVISDVPYVIKSNLQGVKLYGWLPIATQKDNLAQVLFAVGATIKSDLDGILHIEGLWDGVSGSSSKDEMYEGPNVDYASLVTGVSVTEHQYFTGGESVTLFEGTTTAGDIITFSDPMYNLEATGFTILESNANYAKVSAGSGTLTGNKYIHNTREVTASVSSSSSQNVKTVKDATLVSLVNSRAVAERLANYYKCIQEINADVVYGGEKPGDILSTWHPYDKKNVPSCVKSVDITVSNTLKATETSLVGYIPQQIEQTEILENRIILTGSGSLIVPDGVNSLRVVVIGSGNGGQAGSDGTNGARTYLVLTSAEVNAGGSWSEAAGAPGIGGSGGQGGKGGRILQAVLEVAPGEVIQYSAAPGGSGGSENGSAGTAGGDTTFGNLTSANGSVNDSGYTDPITGITYAAKGKDGLDGGDGGKGGTAALNNFTEGGDGEAVGSYPGGYGGSGGYTNSSTGWMYMRYGGGGGGGAADGTNGGGGNGTYGRDGGHGASPPSASNADTYGSGGDGGAGGGGGGSAGSVFFKSDGGTGSTGFWGTLSGGAAGTGAAGGAGADGCIIVYYAQEKPIATGQVVDKNNKMLLDRLGRRVIV